MDKQLPKPVRQALAKAGLGKLEYGYLTKTKKFHVRVLRAEKSILETDEQRWIVQFGYRPTFDRWANSTNFQTEIWYSPTYKIVNNHIHFHYLHCKKNLMLLHLLELQLCATSVSFDYQYFLRI